MKIAFDAKRAFHNFRGLGNYSRGILEGLANFYPEHNYLLYTKPFSNKKIIEWKNRYQKNFQICLPHKKRDQLFSGLWRSYFINEDLMKEKIDIFHGLSHEIPWDFSKKNPFKKIVTIHDLLYLTHPEQFPLIDRLVYNQKFRYAAKHSDLVIAICEQTKLDLIKHFKINPEKIVVHYQSCSPNFYEKNILSNENLEVEIFNKFKIKNKFILHVGAFEIRKNQLNILESFAKISYKTECDLIFIGQGKSYLEEVKAKAKSLKLENRVHFLGSVNHEELPFFYRKAELFFFPSLSEGFGIPIIEALFSKTPVLTTAGGCFPESAGPDSFFIDPLSINEMSNALELILNDLELRKRMIEKGFEFVQKFTSKNTSANLMEIYQKI